MHLLRATDHPSEEVGSALVGVTQQLASIAHSGHHLLFLLLERADDQQPLPPSWYCSLGGTPFGNSSLLLPHLYKLLAKSSPVPKQWCPFDHREPLYRSMEELQWALGSWEEVTNLPNLFIIRTQNPAIGNRCCRRFVNGKPVSPENDDQDDFDLIRTIIHFDPSRPLY